MEFLVMILFWWFVACLGVAVVWALDALLYCLTGKSVLNTFDAWLP